MRDRLRGMDGARTLILGAAFLTALFSQGCLTYSSYQSARIVERGSPSATLGITQSQLLGEDSGGISWWTFDGDMRFGMARRMDGSVRLSVFHSVAEGFGGGQISVDARYGIISDHLAVALPLTATLGDFHFYSLRLQPGLVGTIPLAERLEVNGSVRGHIYVRAPELSAISYSIGLGMTSPSGEWTIRPEVGWLRFTDPGSDIAYFHCGFGIEHKIVAGGSATGSRDQLID